MVRKRNAAVTTHTTAPLPSPRKHSPDGAARGSKHLITAYYSVHRPRKDESLSRPGWLVTYRNKVPPPGVKLGHVTHHSTNRARRRLTLLIRPTPLPLRHAANELLTHCSRAYWWRGRTLIVVLLQDFVRWGSVVKSSGETQLLSLSCYLCILGISELSVYGWFTVYRLLFGLCLFWTFALAVVK